MAFSDVQRRRIEKVVAAYVEKHRPSADIRDELDLSFRITGQSIELFEIRPRWDSRTETTEDALAKARYIKSRSRWLVYWHRADSKWHRYPPQPEVRTVEAFLALVEKDDHSCFYG